MNVQWKKVIIKTTVWLAAEIILNLLGLDNLADYSEFLYEHNTGVLNVVSSATVL
ncbi:MULTISPECIES: hypothetical protein [unclassified Coleofasciculus]|uniref:hypothetical protein n=1 Tax=unclassified Coleofasciculus TaxID=2692782 RepID=UPI00188195B2|nr:MULTISPECIES: hypothetical protein [unclassified Coleofasciculus]MBE9128295.1 hypothetical protein [Coleofasciculus sp. LEGE 07081]MBE9151337.1 hypothetical protein [Coleofasciculus sp. LEGE 07092]